jgi:hypothetical protein
VAANDLVSFLAGRWDNVSFEIADGKAGKREAYPETTNMSSIVTCGARAGSSRSIRRT